MPLIPFSRLTFSAMDLVDRFKETLNTPPGETPLPPPTVSDEMTTSSSTWNTFVESMENARKKATTYFTDSDPSSPKNPKPASHDDPNTPLQDGPAVAEESVVSTTVKQWWEEATTFFEETKITVEEKISELTSPVEIRNDPMKHIRALLVVYTEALEQSKNEAFNLGMAVESMARMSSPMLGKALAEPFGDTGMVTTQFSKYRELQQRLLVPVLDEVRLGVEQLTAMANDEIVKIQNLQTRFKRRDRLHKSLSDMKSRVELKREKNSRRLAEGFQVDSKQMEELYELTRAMDAIDSDFRSTSEQLVVKSAEVLKNRSRTFRDIFLKLGETQNAFVYRLGNSCSFPFQQFVEELRADFPPADEMEEPASLTWRSHASDEEYIPMKTAPSRRATMSFAEPAVAGLTTTATAALAQSDTSPSRYSYKRPPTSPVKRSGTSAVLN